MKTALKQTLKVMGLLLTALALTNCGKDDNNNSNHSYNNNYYQSNGYCYRRSDNQMVNQSYCNGSYNNGGQNTMFTGNGQTCTSNQTGQQVDPRYCQSNVFTLQGNNQCLDTLTNQNVDMIYCQNGYNGGGGYQPYPQYPQSTGQCYGLYYTMQAYYIQYRECYGQNCSGQYLYNYQTGMGQYCQ